MPTVSVIIATWNRGALLLPTLQSALAQQYKDFEIIVVGDGCTDDTEAHIQPFLSENVRWINLPHNTGSQSFPNNVGIAAARGTYIAYLGHDDIWDAAHLGALCNILDTSPEIDFAIAGGLLHGPPDSMFETITGMFEDAEAAAFKHFFPPTTMMHRKSSLRQIGLWRAPMRLKAPVDHEIQLRAANAGLKFKSTNHVTVHKFAAGHRYLAYLDHTATEQVLMLERLKNPDRSWIDTCIVRARQNGRFMSLHHQDFETFEIGQLARRNLFNRGVKLPPLSALTQPKIIEQTAEVRGLDWQPFNPRGFRWSGPNPRPKILLSYTCKAPVFLVIGIFALSVETRRRLKVFVNDVATDFKLQELEDGHFAIELTTTLRENAHTIIMLEAWPGKLNGEMCGLAVGKIIVVPLVERTLPDGKIQHVLPAI
jgi:hypothetical protein